MKFSPVPLLFCVVSLCSCVKEQGEGGMRSVRITFDGPGVRTTLNEDRTGLCWEPGDTIYVHNDADASVAVVIYSGTCAATVDVPSAATMLSARYPSLQSVPFTQRQSVAGKLNGHNYPLSAQAAIMDGKADFQFEPSGSALAVNVYNPCTAGECLCSVSALSAQMTGEYGVIMDTPFTVDEGRPSSPKTYGKQVYLCLERGSYSRVRFRIVTDRGEYEISSDNTVMDCQNNDFLVLNINLRKCSVEVEAGISHEGVADEEYPEPENKDPESPLDLDFSRVGYHYGDTQIPSYPVGRTVSVSEAEGAVAAGQAESVSDFLQKAVDSTPSGKALLLKEGTYVLDSTLFLTRSDFVLRGEGAEKTILLSKVGASHSTIVVGPAYKRTVGSVQAAISDSHIPVGAFYVNVANPQDFSVGDDVEVQRNATAEWIHAIRMDQIDDPEHPSWDPEDFFMTWSRKITGITGTRLYFDLPLPMDIDDVYGGGQVVACKAVRISETGVEDLSVVSDYDPSIQCTSTVTRGAEKVTITYECDENHADKGVTFRAAEHCWAKAVTARNYRMSAFSLQKGSRQITVSECTSLHPVSLLTGSRRYAFNMSGCEGCLVTGCTADEDRHMFVTPNRTDGPNVFLDCTGTNCFSNAGPHSWWATMTLYENVSVDGLLSVEDTGGEAVETSHGWQGANQVFWNCSASSVICQSPWATAVNYAYGCSGTKLWGTYFAEDPTGRDPESWVYTDKWRPDGQWSQDAVPSSLYHSQLESRHSAGRIIWK